MSIQLDRYAPPGPVGEKFLNALGPIDLIMGPAGSGKTVCSVFKGPKIASEYWPVCNDGWVRFKLACIRDTYRDFARTALSTWYEFFPIGHPFQVEHSGGQDRPVKHVLRWKTRRPGYGEIPVEFQMETGAIGDANVEQFIKGYEISAGWGNEIDMMDKRVPGLLFQRTGRYPRVEDIAPQELERVSRDGRKTFDRMGLSYEPNEIILPRIVWGDLNPPDINNWVYEACIKEKWPGYILHRQPSGLSPNAENRVGKPRSSYELEAATQPEHIVRRMVHGEFGYALDGKPVYPEFALQRHRADSPITPREGIPLSIGLDAGGSPAAVIVQFLPNGQLLVLREICAQPGTGPSRFSEMIYEVLISEFPAFAVAEAWGDPSAFWGADKQNDELSFMETVAKALSIYIMPAPSNEPAIRQEAVRWYLGAPIDANTERMQIDPRNDMIIGGFAAHYKLTKQASAGETNQLAVAKNMYSHPHDALQYVCLGHRGRFGVIQDASQLGRPDNVVGMRQRRQQKRPSRDRMQDTKLW
ncbi:hypothetical protein [Roseibium album]|uniref:hypothetical protein n=1 Tax=Roseibium album TaxID=311410 RepID=UPI002491A162|nr:hypothetical protein [Roseibium album]